MTSEQATISVAGLASRLAEGPVEILDVRTPLEFGAVHVDGARNVPLAELEPHAVFEHRNEPHDEPLYVICQAGQRGGQAQQKLLAAGFKNVVNVEGGTDAWLAAGLPVVKGKKTISLERQVRMAAGLIVFAGSVATLATGNIYFAGIPAFVGAGLAFAGITDSCAMGMLIAKMPWNRVKKGPPCTTACSTRST